MTWHSAGESPGPATRLARDQLTGVTDGRPGASGCRWAAKLGRAVGPVRPGHLSAAQLQHHRPHSSPAVVRYAISPDAMCGARCLYAEVSNLRRRVHGQHSSRARARDLGTDQDGLV